MALLLAIGSTGTACGQATLALEGVTIVDVEDGRRRPGQTVIITGDRITAIGDDVSLALPAGSVVMDARGRFLVPGLWDMHVHSHRLGRERYHHPLFLANGVLGVRDAGTFLPSARVAMRRVREDARAPEVIWGSPPLDGPTPVLPFGLGIESEAAADEAVEWLKTQGFDFVKVYDRLSPTVYSAVGRAAARVGMRLEGHVPLASSPEEAIAAGQDLIDHLTLVVESCVPGALEHIHALAAASPGEVDSLGLMMDPELARRLPDYDEVRCGELFERFAAREVWQVPTLVQALGFFLPEEARRRFESRVADTPPELLAGWREAAASEDPAGLAAGASIYRKQRAALRPMLDAGVKLLVGTDASNEAWVFAGTSVHDEMGLFVEAGLSPLEALQAATLRPLQYMGRIQEGRVISAGELADLVLLDHDPLLDIAHTRAIRAVIKRGQVYDRRALDELLAEARAFAAAAGAEPQ